MRRVSSEKKTREEVKMDTKVKKILKATKQENMNPAIDFASGQRGKVNGVGNEVRTSQNGSIPSNGATGQFGGFINKNK